MLFLGVWKREENEREERQREKRIKGTRVGKKEGEKTKKEMKVK